MLFGMALYIVFNYVYNKGVAFRERREYFKDLDSAKSFVSCLREDQEPFMDDTYDVSLTKPILEKSYYEIYEIEAKAIEKKKIKDFNCGGYSYS